jgi:surface antigen
MYTAILAIVLLTSTPKPVDNLNQVQPIPFPDRTIAAQTAIAADQARIAAAEAERAALEAQQYQTPEPIETPVIQPYTGSNGYSYGQCTAYVASRRNVPNGWGNASNWFYAAQASGYATGSAPRPGAIGVEKGINHVVYIESVSGDSVVVSEQNYVGWNIVSKRTAPASAFNYIY